MVSWQSVRLSRACPAFKYRTTLHPAVGTAVLVCLLPLRRPIPKKTLLYTRDELSGRPANVSWMIRVLGALISRAGDDYVLHMRLALHPLPTQPNPV